MPQTILSGKVLSSSPKASSSPAAQKFKALCLSARFAGHAALVASMRKFGWLILVVLFFCGGLCGIPPASLAERERAAGTEASSGDLQMIEERMALLTGSLKEIPQLPKLNATIIFPERRGEEDNPAGGTPEKQRASAAGTEDFENVKH